MAEIIRFPGIPENSPSREPGADGLTLADLLAKVKDASAAFTPDGAGTAELYRPGAEAGDPRWQVSLGICYFNGTGVPPDPKEGLAWFRKAAAQGDARAHFLIGETYLHGLCGAEKDPAKGYAFFLKAAQLGSVEAQHWAGLCLECGRGTAQDRDAAMRFFAKAAAQGRAESQYFYGLRLIDAGNAQEGRAWIMRASEQEEGGALFFLATEASKLGDDALAYALNTRAAEAGEPHAMVNCGIMAQGGCGVPRDVAAARHWLAKAAGDPNDEIAARATELLAQLLSER